MIAHRELDVNKAGARGIDTIFTLSLKIAPESLCLAIVTAVGANGADVMQKSAPTTFMYRYCISCESCSPLDIKLPPPNIFACPIRWGVGLRRRVRRRLPDPCCDQDGTRPARDGDGAQSDTRRRGTECSDLVLRHGRGHCPHPRHSVRDDEARADRSVVRGCSGRGHTTCAIRARKCVLCPPPHRSNVPPLASSPAFFLRFLPCFLRVPICRAISNHNSTGYIAAIIAGSPLKASGDVARHPDDVAQTVRRVYFIYYLPLHFTCGILLTI